jgi:hypothetical protein
MLNKIIKIFKEPEQGMVKLSFIALDENDVPYEDTATVPYSDEFDAKVVEAKFRKFMLLRKHLVVEVIILEVVKTGVKE